MLNKKDLKKISSIKGDMLFISPFGQMTSWKKLVALFIAKKEKEILSDSSTT